MTAQPVYHITPLAEWRSAHQAGVYTADSLNAEGFIHCSTREQVLGVADSLYTGQNGLVLLEIDTDRLAAPLKFEDTYGHGALFPHIYGPLNLDAVVRVLQFEPDSQTGKFSWPVTEIPDERI